MSKGNGRELEAWVGALRRRWRRRGVRTALLAAGAGAGLAVLVLALLSQLAGLPPGARPLLRWVPVGTFLLVGVPLLLRALRPPSPEALVLRAEAAFPELEHLPRTLLTLPRHHPLRSTLEARIRRVLPGASPHGVLPTPSGRTVAAAGLPILLAGIVLVAMGGPVAAWKAWGAGAAAGGRGAEPVLPVAGEGSDEGAAPPSLAGVRWRAEPPAYTRLSPRTGSAEEGIEAVAGSRLTLEGVEAGWGRRPGVRVIRAGGEGPPVPSPVPAGEGWAVEWVLSPEDRGVELAPEGKGGGARLVPLRVLLDVPPAVELLEPSRDLVVATGSGELRLRARARDPYGLEAFHLDWVHTRGSGESFDFREGEWAWQTVEGGDGVWEGERVVRLDDLGLGPGDVLHVRAVARDVNRVTGPGTGISSTRVLRVMREGEEMEVDALLGFPVEGEMEPVLTQRMILLMTMELLERAPELEAGAFAAEAGRIAREQARVRAQLGDQIYSRATGGMEPVLLGREGGGAGGGAPPTGPVEPPSPPVSRYGVALVFDPSAGRAHGEPGMDPSHPSGHDHDHDHDHDEGIPLEMGAGTEMGTFPLGGGMPVGFGRLEELGHDHDGDPILSVNRPLLAIYDEMWESERFLLLVDPGASVPHQERAVEGLQALRENRRVFPRGVVRAPPVDVEGVRGSGDVSDATPAPRTPRDREETGGELDRLARVDALSRALSGAWNATLADQAHVLALELLADPHLPQGIAALAVEAAHAAREGDREASRARLRELRDRLAPPPARGTAGDFSHPRTALSTGWMGSSGGGEEVAPGAPVPGRRPVAPFVFATLRYQSGNWDSAPLVPQNLIHALAQYTELPVAPEGVVVDLASDEIFRFPVLYLTGHLPVRFSEAEARNLRAYVDRGGFVFMDDHNHDVDGAFHRTATAELARIFGEDALAPLPGDHELYRTFFAFPDGPPTTSHELSGWGDGLIHPELHAIRVDGRIGILYSNKDYSSEWNYHAVNKRFLAVDNTRFGVNILLYALTR